MVHKAPHAVRGVMDWQTFLIATIASPIGNSKITTESVILSFW